ncbi:HAD family phosphatase [Methylobacterium currus]|uniref:HAD family phosphatase n=1 Tax=Methylobacterium currus TaxID=2051553 RepID=A0A2R4WU73_9HYPH|nr:HAD family phosphatase [Methylobacterium currus]AWB25089.1 HAD family phosphatase [Methylobacterium currus]UHC16599.1 HAD family phosphatase [Methylobacterium currus]
MVADIELVLFDLDNVLYHYDRRRRVEHLSEITGIPADDIDAAIWDSGLEFQGDSGALAPQAYLQAFGDRIGYPVSLTEWLEARRASVAPNDQMLALVERLRASTEVAILTNNSELLTRHIDVICPELRPLFGDRIYASAAFRSAKPEIACFQRCLAGLGVGPSSVLFVDDLPENVAGARAAGLHAHHFTSVDAFRRDLAARGVDG